MKLFKLSNMVKGWFIGNFSPTAFKTSEIEVAIKYYRKGAYEPFHHHKKSVEYTAIVSGKVEMSGSQFSAGDIIQIESYESTDFKVLEDTATVVVKIPSIRDDKFLD